MIIHVNFPPGIIPLTPTPEMNIIPAPSPTISSENANITETPSSANAIEINGVKTGAYVQVFGTGGTGLRLHSEPGATAQTIVIASENEGFLVVDGPRDLDGHIWWKLEAPYQSTRGGWAAADFLSPIITPTPGG
jgi:hypothetical protein